MDIITQSNFKNKEIIFVKPIKIGSIYKMRVVVNDNTILVKRLNRLIFISPIMELNINWKNLKFQYLVQLSLEPLIGLNSDLNNLINMFENLACNKLKNTFGNSINFKSILFEINNNDQFIDNNNIFTSSYINLKIIKNALFFDTNSIKTDFINIDLVGLLNYKFLIEFTDIWFDINTLNCGCNFNIVQIKYYPLYYNIDLIREDNTINNNIVSARPKSSFIPPPPPAAAKAKAKAQASAPIQSRPSISPDQLLLAINKLKKTV